MENLYKEDLTNLNRKYLKENFGKDETFQVKLYALINTEKEDIVLESEEDGIYVICRNT